MIRVEYDGSYPTTCMGRLKIYDDDELIYDHQFCCHSTGSVWFDSEWNEHVEEGILLWNEDEAKNFNGDIQEAVREKLSNFYVCCGGCV